MRSSITQYQQTDVCRLLVIVADHVRHQLTTLFFPKAMREYHIRPRLTIVLRPKAMKVGHTRRRLTSVYKTNKIEVGNARF